MSGISVRKAWIGVAVALSAVAWACTFSTPGPERVHVPAPTLEATPERAPYGPPYDLLVVDRSESTLSVVWDSTNYATYYEVKRSGSEDGEYAIVATKVATLGLVDIGLQPDSLYYYGVRSCNHLGCSEFNDKPVAGLTESDADVGAPAAPKDVKFSRREVTLFPDRDVVTWTAVEGATYYNVYRAGDLLTEVSAPLTRSSHTDVGRSLGLTHGGSYQVSACNKSGCSPLSQEVSQYKSSQ